MRRKTQFHSERGDFFSLKSVASVVTVGKSTSWSRFFCFLSMRMQKGIHHLQKQPDQGRAGLSLVLNFLRGGFHEEIGVVARGPDGHRRLP